MKSTVSLRQEHVSSFQKQFSASECKSEELELYGRRLCLRIESFPSVESESLDDVFNKVKSLITKSVCEILDEVIDRAHRIGNGCKDKTRNVLYKTIIFRLSTFRHRTMFYQNRNKLKNAKVRLDLTKTHYKAFPDSVTL